jgi:acylphosphatase
MGEAKESARLEAVVSGRVQGVGYRYFALDVARKLGLRGWVRNMPTGQVEVVAEGPREALMRFLIALERGPHYASVENVQTTWLPASGEFKDFRIKY